MPWRIPLLALVSPTDGPEIEVDSLLVAPIYDESGRRHVYLLKGGWTDWWTGEQLCGPRWVEVSAPLERMPLYVREGGIVPLGPVLQYVDERPTEEITLRIAPFSADGRSSFVVPVDDETVAVRYEAMGPGHTTTSTILSFRAELGQHVHVQQQFHAPASARGTMRSSMAQAACVRGISS